MFGSIEEPEAIMIAAIITGFFGLLSTSEGQKVLSHFFGAVTDFVITVVKGAVLFGVFYIVFQLFGQILSPPEPSTVPVNTPQIRIQPIISTEQVVRDYYELINQRNYEIAWSQLTTGYQRRASEGNYNAYVAWWDSVNIVNVGEVTLVTQSDSTATVYAELWYMMKDGRVIVDTTPYIRLTRDTTNSAWFIDGKSP